MRTYSINDVFGGANEGSYRNYGLTWFKNPNSQGPLNAVAYCFVDSMYHLNMRYSPYDDDPDYKYVQRILIRMHDKHYIEPIEELRQGVNAVLIDSDSKACQSAGEYLLSQWYGAGSYNLVNLPLFLSQIPELKTEPWLSEQISSFRQEHNLGTIQIDRTNKMITVG